MGDLVLPCYSFIRESIIATNDLLGSIERDIEESRLFIRSRNDVQVNWTLLVDSLKTDNEILNERLNALQNELSLQQIKSDIARDVLQKDFEEKILACNGEIERIIAECDAVMFAKEHIKLELINCQAQLEDSIQKNLHREKKSDYNSFIIDSLKEENDKYRQRVEQSDINFAELKEAYQRLKEMHRNQQEEHDEISRSRLREVTELLRRVGELEAENAYLRSNLANQQQIQEKFPDFENTTMKSNQQQQKQQTSVQQKQDMDIFSNEISLTKRDTCSIRYAGSKQEDQQDSINRSFCGSRKKRHKKGNTGKDNNNNNNSTPKKNDDSKVQQNHINTDNNSNEMLKKDNRKRNGIVDNNNVQTNLTTYHQPLTANTINIDNSTATTIKEQNNLASIHEEQQRLLLLHNNNKTSFPAAASSGAPYQHNASTKPSRHGRCSLSSSSDINSTINSSASVINCSVPNNNTFTIGTNSTAAAKSITSNNMTATTTSRLLSNATATPTTHMFDSSTINLSKYIPNENLVGVIGVGADNIWCSDIRTPPPPLISVGINENISYNIRTKLPSSGDDKAFHFNRIHATAAKDFVVDDNVSTEFNISPPKQIEVCHNGTTTTSATDTTTTTTISRPIISTEQHYRDKTGGTIITNNCGTNNDLVPIDNTDVNDMSKPQLDTYSKSLREGVSSNSADVIKKENRVREASNNKRQTYYIDSTCCYNDSDIVYDPSSSSTPFEMYEDEEDEERNNLVVTHNDYNYKYYHHNIGDTNSSNENQQQQQQQQHCLTNNAMGQVSEASLEALKADNRTTTIDNWVTAIARKYGYISTTSSLEKNELPPLPFIATQRHRSIIANTDAADSAAANNINSEDETNDNIAIYHDNGYDAICIGVPRKGQVMEERTVDWRQQQQQQQQRRNQSKSEDDTILNTRKQQFAATFLQNDDNTSSNRDTENRDNRNNNTNYCDDVIRSELYCDDNGDNIILSPPPDEDDARIQHHGSSSSSTTHYDFDGEYYYYDDETAAEAVTTIEYEQQYIYSRTEDDDDDEEDYNDDDKNSGGDKSTLSNVFFYCDENVKSDEDQQQQQHHLDNSNNSNNNYHNSNLNSQAAAAALITEKVHQHHHHMLIASTQNHSDLLFPDDNSYAAAGGNYYLNAAANIQNDDDDDDKRLLLWSSNTLQLEELSKLSI